MSQRDAPPRRSPSTPAVEHTPVEPSSTRCRGGQGPARRPCRVCDAALGEPVDWHASADAARQEHYRCPGCGAGGTIIRALDGGLRRLVGPAVDASYREVSSDG